MGEKYAFSPLFSFPYNHFPPNLLFAIFLPLPGQTEKYTPLIILLSEGQVFERAEGRGAAAEHAAAEQPLRGHPADGGPRGETQGGTGKAGVTSTSGIHT